MPRVDIPGDWVDFVVASPTPYYIEPLFTRDPAQISEIQVLMAMMAIKGIYAPYEVERLNHGIGFDTAAIELLLPTYAAALGLKGKICRHWALNPHPALIPAIEAGFVESVHSFGSELGMERLHSGPARCVLYGPTAACAPTAPSARRRDITPAIMFIGSTLQIDLDGQQLDRNVSAGSPASAARPTWARTRAAADTQARRGSKAGREAGADRTACRADASSSCRWSRPSASTWQPAFVERLDAWELAERAAWRCRR